MTAAPVSAETEGSARNPDASALCLGCGLCCNGVLFAGVRAEPDELARLQNPGLIVEREGEKLRFRQPCPHHRDGRCAVYSERFAKCRTFRCALLKRLDAGEVGLGEAQATVAQARRMLVRVTDLDPAADQFSVRRANRAAGAPAGGEGAADRGRLLVESLALDLFFDRKFRNRKAVRMDESRKADGEER